MSVSSPMPVREAADAAALLGVPPDADLPALRRAFRRLSSAWGPDKALEAFERERFRAQSAAYTMLVARCKEGAETSGAAAPDASSGNSNGRGNNTDAAAAGAAPAGGGDLDLDYGAVAAADESEHRAILRLYKDLLSFYSDEESVRDTISPEVRLAIGMLPAENSERYNWTSEDEEGFDQDFAAAMAANDLATASASRGGAVSGGVAAAGGSRAAGGGGSAGGGRAGGVSSDEGDDDDAYDDEDDDGEDSEGVFDPSSKRFSPLNFKDPASLERYLTATGDKFSYEMHMKRKLKNAKKKAEQRRKQKERRLREAAEKEEEAARQREREAEQARQAEEALRLKREEQRRAQELEAERRKQLFAAASRGDLEALKSIFESAGSTLRVTERMNESGRSGSGLLHAVFGGVEASPEEGQRQLFTDADRVTLARYLLSMKSPSIDLSVLDEDGCNVLHIAARVGRLPFVNTIIENRSETQEKRNQLDLNARCLQKGYTALHYAAESGHYDVCEKLVDIGVLLNVHASYSKNKLEEASNMKGPTPLELVKTKLELSTLSQSERQNYERISEKIESILAKLEKAKQAREQERLAKEAKQKAEKEAQLLKEQKERELMERKQKQLREKQEKLGKQEAQPQQREDAEAASADSKKKKKEQKEKQGTGGGSSEHQEEAKDSKEATNSVQKKGAKAGAGKPLSEDARRDLCRHLMSMGFAESDCNAAIDACGANVEAAISWICDRPKQNAVRSVPETPIEAAIIKASLAPSLSVPPQPTAAAKSPASEEEALALKLQREREKLREINRKWNAKVPQQRAEEERKRAQQEEELRLEAERKKLSQSLAPHLSSFSPEAAAVGPPPPPLIGASSQFPYGPGRSGQMLATSLSPGVAYPPPLPGSLGTASIVSAVNASPFFPNSAAGRFQTSPVKMAPYPLAPTVPAKTSGKASPVAYGAASAYGKGAKSRNISPVVSLDFTTVAAATATSASDQADIDGVPDETFSNGAVELSVSAKEFVPKFGPGAGPTSTAGGILKPTPIGLGLGAPLGGLMASTPSLPDSGPVAVSGASAPALPVAAAAGTGVTVAPSTSSILDMGLWGTGSAIGGLGISGLGDLGAGLGAADVSAPLLFPSSSAAAPSTLGSAWSDLFSSLGSSSAASQKSTFPVAPLPSLHLPHDSSLNLDASGILDSGLLGGFDSLVGLGSGLPLGDFGGGAPLGSLAADIDFSPAAFTSLKTTTTGSSSSSLGGPASMLCSPADPMFPLPLRSDVDSDFASILNSSGHDGSLLNT